MKKVLIEKHRSFETGLFAALAMLELAECLEVCGSTKAYSKNLISKWNRKAAPEQPQYLLRIVPTTENGVVTDKVMVFRVK